MPRNQDARGAADHDQRQALREQQATDHLLGQGADGLPARPWRPEPAPPSAGELAQFALWRAADLDPEALLSALTLLPAARDELDGLEAGLLFTARGSGLTWAQIALAMGFRSPQACQQHFQRLTSRTEAGQ